MIDLRCGDCLEIMKQIPDKSIDMILCDLPYGITACKWDMIIPLDKMWEGVNRIIKDHGSVLLFGCEPFSSKLRMSNMENYRYDWIWKKNKSTQYLNANKIPLNNYEIISVFYKKLPTSKPVFSYGKVYSNFHKAGDSGDCYGKVKCSQRKNISTRYPTRIIEFDVDTIKARFHPTQKPVPLLEYLIKTYTQENDTVLDFTMGSGSTGVACKYTNRNFIGIELNKEYFNIAKKRIENGFAQKEITQKDLDSFLLFKGLTNNRDAF